MRSLIFGLGIGLYGAVTIIIGNMQGEGRALQQAHERGYAVECVGQTGYHWECEK